MNKLILLSEEQMNDLTAILNEVDLTKSKLFGFGEIYKKLWNLRDALSHDLTDEIVEKIKNEPIKFAILDCDKKYVDIGKYMAQEIINSYKGGK